MSFTQDELDAFNTILEQKLAIHRRELELSLDRRLSMLRQTLEQSLATQQDLLRNLPLRLLEQQHETKDIIHQHPEPHQTRMIDSLEQGDAQIAEIQAEISWDDLIEVIDNVVEKRLSALANSVQALIKNTENSLLTQVHSLRSDLLAARQSHTGPLTTDDAPIPDDVFASVAQLEHIVEALQVTMAANHALLSTRLYQHQHRPLEHAHPIAPDDVHSEDEEG